jgi:hypothetical protein
VAVGDAISPGGVVWTLAVAAGFLVAAVLVGRFAVPRLFDLA